MASLCKPIYVKPVPPGSKIITKAGVRYARIRRRGQYIDCPLTDDGTRCRIPTEKYYGAYTDADGKRRRVPLFTDKDASQTMLTEIVKGVVRIKSGMAEAPKPPPPPDPMEDHKTRPIGEHLADYRRSLQVKGDTEKTVKTLCAIVEKTLEACEYKTIGDMLASREKVANWLFEQRQPKWDGEKQIPGLSVCTSNYNLGAFKSFVRWLTEEDRMIKNPFLKVKKLNAETDRRHVRRAEPMTTIWRIIGAAKASNKSYCRLSGPDRAILYTTAAYTGFRAQELASLTPASLTLGDQPTLTVEARRSKHRKKDVQPIPADLAELLAGRFEGLPRDARFWPGKWWKEGAEMLRIDLKAAGVPYLDEDDQVFDFHAIRHSYITTIAKSGANPKDVQKLARHASFQMTFDRYSHVSLSDSAAAIDCLPALPESQQVRATGTDNTVARQVATTFRPDGDDRKRTLPLVKDKEYGLPCETVTTQEEQQTRLGSFGDLRLVCRRRKRD